MLEIRKPEMTKKMFHPDEAAGQAIWEEVKCDYRNNGKRPHAVNVRAIRKLGGVFITAGADGLLHRVLGSVLARSGLNVVQCPWLPRGASFEP